jgi:hypothetical protein
MFEYSLLDLVVYVWFSKILRVDSSRGEEICYKHAKIFEFGEFLELRHGGATTGHRAGKCDLAGEDEDHSSFSSALAEEVLERDRLKREKQ